MPTVIPPLQSFQAHPKPLPRVFLPYQWDINPPELPAQLAVDLQQNLLHHAPDLAGMAQEGLGTDDLQRGETQGKVRLETARDSQEWRLQPTWEGTGVCTQQSFLMAP